jgi:hypothetical protein
MNIVYPYCISEVKGKDWTTKEESGGGWDTNALFKVLRNQ